MKKKKKNPWKTANPEWAKAEAERRRSSVAQPHDERPKRLRTRKEIRRFEIEHGED